jgi:N-glycosylase/DNA lyase
MKRILKKICYLQKDKKLEQLIRRRLKEFEKNKNLFSELCFCTLTAGASAESGLKCQDALKDRFRKLSKGKLQNELKKLGYRFHNRAEYIRKNQVKINLLNQIRKMDSKSARQFLVKNFRGIGMKEASHFLRNTGRKNVAIIDRHILRSLGFGDVRALTEKKYLEIEKKLEKIAELSGLNLAELDLYLWSDQTGRVLK